MSQLNPDTPIPPHPDTPTLPPPSLAGAKTLVMGLGRFGGGVGVAQWLVSQGAIVTVTDAAPESELTESIAKLAGLTGAGGGITFKLGGHDTADFLNTDLLIINPAVDKTKSAPVQAALAKGIPYTTEMNLFLERCLASPATGGGTIGITGSVGKSTTTALIFEALQAALETRNSKLGGGETRNVFLGGNIGRSLLLDLPNIRPQDFVILELSSFMLEDTPRILRPDGSVGWSPHIAVVTNIFPNHLDRHHTMAAYTAAKQNILKFQKPSDIAILNNDHDLVSRWVHFAKGRVIKYTTRGPADKIPPLLIPGEHNRSNAAAALAVLDALTSQSTTPIPPHSHTPVLLPLNRPAAIHAISTFPGLPHRLQLVHSLDLASATASAPPRQLRFYNDSKATTPEASITAVEAFPPRTAIFIVGGYDKHIDLSAFIALLAERAAAVLGIGQTGQAMVDAVNASTIPASKPSPTPLATYSQTLAQAVDTAFQLARDNPAVAAVVLSPASASWDQFRNYEQRGDEFAQHARTLRQADVNAEGLPRV